MVVTLPVNQGDSFPCRKCFGARAYETHNDLKRHLGKKHPDTELVFRCHLCQQDVANVRGYFAHIKSSSIESNDFIIVGKNQDEVSEMASETEEFHPENETDGEVINSDSSEVIKDFEDSSAMEISEPDAKSNLVI